jgi:hypothetical protein
MPRAKKPASNTRSRGKGRGKKANVIEIDFEGVESGSSRIDDGSYPFYPSAIEEGVSSNDNPMLTFKWKCASGKFKGATLYDNITLVPQALWKLKQVLEAMGEEVDGVYSLDLDALMDEDNVIEIEVANEDYEGRDRPKAVGYFPLSDGEAEEPEEEEEEPEEEEEGEEEEEEEAPKKKRSRKSSKPRPIKVGSKVKFEDEEGDVVRGVVTEKNGDMLTVEDSDGDDWEIPVDEVTAA